MNFDKSSLRYSIFRSLLCLCLGLFLLISPEGSLTTFVRLIAIVFIFSALFSLYFAWKRGEEMESALQSPMQKQDRGLQRLLILNSFVCIIFALLLFVFPSFFTGLTMFLVAIILLLSAIFQFIGLIQFKKAVQHPVPWYLYLNPFFVVVLAIVIMFNPFTSALMLTIFSGIICIVYAVLEIIQVIYEYRISKKSLQ